MSLEIDFLRQKKHFAAHDSQRMRHNIWEVMIHLLLIAAATQLLQRQLWQPNVPHQHSTNSKWCATLRMKLKSCTGTGIKQNKHDFRDVESNPRTQPADRSIRFKVSYGSLMISATPVCYYAELSQWAPRVLLVQTGSRACWTGCGLAARSQWNLNL